MHEEGGANDDVSDDKEKPLKPVCAPWSGWEVEEVLGRVEGQGMQDHPTNQVSANTYLQR